MGSVLSQLYKDWQVECERKVFGLKAEQVWRQSCTWEFSSEICWKGLPRCFVANHGLILFPAFCIVSPLSCSSLGFFLINYLSTNAYLEFWLQRTACFTHRWLGIKYHSWSTNKEWYKNNSFYSDYSFAIITSVIVPFRESKILGVKTRSTVNLASPRCATLEKLTSHFFLNSIGLNP